MPNIIEIVDSIDELVRTVRLKEAQEKLESLITTMQPNELARWEADLRQKFLLFHRKRQRRLNELLDQSLGKEPTIEAEPGVGSPRRAPDLHRLREDLRAALSKLSAHHLFQWSTFYRDTLLPLLDEFSDSASEGASVAELTNILRSELASHSREIFDKGVSYTSFQPGADADLTRRKGLSGLQSLLDIPIEYYSHRAGSHTGVDGTTNLRKLTSAAVGGILEGFAAVKFGSLLGSHVLPRYQRAWASYVAFLDVLSLEQLFAQLQPGDFVDNVLANVRPLAGALDDLAKGDRDPLLPVISEYNYEKRYFEISLRAISANDVPRLLVVRCYLEAAYVSRLELQGAEHNEVRVLVAPVKSDILDFANNNPTIARILINATESAADSGPPLRRAIFDRLTLAHYERRSERAASAPLAFNFARDFPLNKPDLPPFYHVHRPSVRELLRSLEYQTGVRLWCSVRRSGKTTACFDLASSSDDSIVVSQTCSSVRVRDGDDLLHESVKEALRGAKPVRPDFFRVEVARAAGRDLRHGGRIVLIIDEYERLFGLLDSQARANELVRFGVVLPLLDQMVAFTREHLLVFLGQQPHAHFILMGHNQLSAYLRQDPFPLFQHSPGSTSGELAQLVTSVLTSRVRFDKGFLDALFEESAGHPFLTVNLLVTLVEWLIQERRTLGGLSLDGDDFRNFSETMLTPGALNLNPDLEFFRATAQRTLTDTGQHEDPWAYSMYAIARRLALDSPQTLSCSRGEFVGLVQSLGLPTLGFTPDDLLRTGSQANFLAFDQEVVRPRIPILGRIAAAVAPKVGA